MINIKDLTFSYNKLPPLFSGLSIDVESGNITGLLGKNGAGKTSLLKLIVGLLTPNSGLIKVMKHRPKNRLPDFLGDLFFVPEEFYFPSVSIRNYIKANSGFYPNFELELMEKLLDEFGLSSNKLIHKLSYGQKKKFLISFCLASRCRLMAMDEPTNGLDIPSKAIFRKVMAGSLEEDQLVIISTHQVRDVENLIDRIIILDDGKVLMKKEIHEISDQLQFSHSTDPDGENVLYSELAPGGFKIITPSVMDSSPIDIELLFNAVTKGKKIFSNHENI